MLCKLPHKSHKMCVGGCEKGCKRDNPIRECLSQNRPVTLKHDWDFARLHYRLGIFKSELKLSPKPITDWIKRLINT